MANKRNLVASIEMLQRLEAGSLSIDPLSKGGRTYNYKTRLEEERLYKKQFRAKHCLKKLQVEIRPDTQANLAYICREWGFGSNREAVEVAIRHLASDTKRGLAKIEFWDAEKDA